MKSIGFTGKFLVTILKTNTRKLNWQFPNVCTENFSNMEDWGAGGDETLSPLVFDVFIILWNWIRKREREICGMETREEGQCARGDRGNIFGRIMCDCSVVLYIVCGKKQRSDRTKGKTREKEREENKNQDERFFLRDDL